MPGCFFLLVLQWSRVFLGVETMLSVSAFMPTLLTFYLHRTVTCPLIQELLSSESPRLAVRGWETFWILGR